jgi:hypothetical protein
MMDFERPIRHWAAFLFLTVAGLAPAATLPAPAILPNAKLVVGLRVNGVLNGISDLLPPDWRTHAAASLSAMPLAGFDPFRDLDEVVISSTGEGANPPTLIWLRGHFPVSELAEHATLTSRGVPLLRVGANGPNAGAIAFPDVTTALAGDEDQVRAALDRMSNPGPLPEDLIERAAELRAKYDVWGFGTRIEKASLPDSAAEAIKPLDAVQFGASLTDGLDASIRLDVHSTADMAKLAMAIQLIETMLKTQPATKSAKLDLKTEGTTIRIGITIPRDEWKKALAGQRDAVTKAMLAQIHGPGLPSSTMRLVTPKPPAIPGPIVVRQWAPPAPPEPPAKPVTKIANSEDGATVIVTLPGRK